MQFLLDEIRKHPGEITIIAIGPEGNLGAAIRQDAATFKKVKRVVLMGGSVYRGYGDQHRPPEPEWNIDRDPAVGQGSTGLRRAIFMLPLDSTQIHLQAPQREQIFAFGSPLTDQLTLLYHQWVAHTDNHSPNPTLFDPVAVTYAIHPELCPAKPLRIEVDDKGLTKPVQGEPNAPGLSPVGREGVHGPAAEQGGAPVPRINSAQTGQKILNRSLTPTVRLCGEN